MSEHIARCDPVACYHISSRSSCESDKAWEIRHLVNASRSFAIECKGRAPGGAVELDEVEAWLGKLRVMRARTLPPKIAVVRRKSSSKSRRPARSRKTPSGTSSARSSDAQKRRSIGRGARLSPISRAP